MKKFYLTLLAVFVYVMLSSQEMSTGVNFLSFGLGPSVNYWTVYHSGGTPAIRIMLDHGFKKAGPGTVTLGGSLGFFTKYYKSNYIDKGYVYNYRWNWTYISTVFRAGYYYNLKEADIPDMNVYGGLGAGLLFSSFKYKYDNPNHPPMTVDEGGTDFILNLYVGANYFLTSKAAIFLEFGYDISYATVGLTIKL